MLGMNFFRKKEYTDRQIYYSAVWYEMADKAMLESLRMLKNATRVHDQDTIMFFLLACDKYKLIAKYCLIRHKKALSN